MRCLLLSAIRVLVASQLIGFSVLITTSFAAIDVPPTTADSISDIAANIINIKRAQRSGNFANSAKQFYKRKVYQDAYQPYNDEENQVHRVHVSWSQFLEMQHADFRNRHVIRPYILKALQRCTTFDSLAAADNTTTASTATGASNCATGSAKDIWNDLLISQWRNRMAKDLCEANAASKISCFDSMGKSRYCIFENAMMNFAKVRKRKQKGEFTRSWERGFLSADCGDMAPDDIGYSLLYKPDIDQRDNAICDFVFNETVVVFSHDNIRNFGSMVSDYLNVWSMLWLTGLSAASRDLSFLTIDAMKRGKFFGDQTNYYFRNYHASFRRVLRGVEFSESNAKVCFKRLIMQPRPALQFVYDGSGSSGGGGGSSSTSIDGSISSSSSGCPVPHSSLLQRFNLQIRQNYGLLHEDSMPTDSQLRILLLVRSLSPAAKDALHFKSRLFSNQQQIVQSLQTLVDNYRSQESARGRKLLQNLRVASPENDKSSSSDSSGNRRDLEVSVHVQDLSLLSFDEQVKLIGSSSIVVGMYGAGIASSIHMPVGTRYCCGVIELFPQAEFKHIRGYVYLAKRMGHHYMRLEIPSVRETTSLASLTSPSLLKSPPGGSTSNSSSVGSHVPVDVLAAAVNAMIIDITNAGGSCFVPEVIDKPYL